MIKFMLKTHSQNSIKFGIFVQVFVMCFINTTIVPTLMIVLQVGMSKLEAKVNNSINITSVNL